MPIYVSPEQIKVEKPFFNNELRFEKKVGWKGKEVCYAQITVPKSFYNALEIVYLTLYIDNSRVSSDCNIIISHKINQYPCNDNNLSGTVAHEQTFPAAQAHEGPKFVTLQFPLKTTLEKMIKQSKENENEHYRPLQQLLTPSIEA